MVFQKDFEHATSGRGTYEITDNLQDIVSEAGVSIGLCHVFVHHTSASLTLCENADPAVREDLETFMARLVPDGSPQFMHDSEGPDDMPAHIRTILTQTGLSIPVKYGQCDLGTWQGVYLWEHRTSGFQRRLTVTVQGVA